MIYSNTLPNPKPTPQQKFANSIAGLAPGWIGQCAAFYKQQRDGILNLPPANKPPSKFTMRQRLAIVGTGLATLLGGSARLATYIQAEVANAVSQPGGFGTWPALQAAAASPGSLWAFVTPDLVLTAGVCTGYALPTLPFSYTTPNLETYTVNIDLSAGDGSGVPVFVLTASDGGSTPTGDPI